jgi:multimeric flavodoxin WrbA
MNILILAGIPRKGGNTDLLVEAFELGQQIESDYNGNK